MLNVNPRSIYNKVENLKTYITENNVDLVCVSESWARKSQPIEDVLKMDNYTVICNPNLRRQIGGTPAIIVNSSKFIVDIPDITPPWGAEIVWCVLTLKNTTTASLVKRLVVGSFITITSAISPNLAKYSFSPSVIINTITKLDLENIYGYKI